MVIESSNIYAIMDRDNEDAKLTMPMSVGILAIGKLHELINNCKRIFNLEIEIERGCGIFIVDYTLTLKGKFKEIKKCMLVLEEVGVD